jgi:type IV pilus assembly protein PilO
MPDLRDTRRKVKIAIGAMAGVSLVALGVLFSPLVGSTATRQQELTQLTAQLQSKSRQLEPLRGLDKKIPLASQQISQFYKDRFSAHDSEVVAAIGNLAKETGVKLENVRYKGGDSESVGLRRLEIDTSIVGDYQPIVKFINGLERSRVFFILNSVGIAQQNGPLQLQVKLETYQKVGN